jgi:mono/diheme cytochrome c family protein
VRQAIFFAALGLLAAGCRGQPSSDPPIHLVPDMDWQPKYRPEQESAFFSDGRTMRQPVNGTIAFGHLDEDDALYRGLNADGSYVARVPGKVDEKTLARGEERFNIYCSVCHDRTGGGKGMVPRRTKWMAADLSVDRLRTAPDGQIYDTITNGRNTMPSYRAQIPVEDRWAIVAWVRVLQRSQHATAADVPPGVGIEPEGANP